MNDQFITWKDVYFKGVDFYEYQRQIGQTKSTGFLSGKSVAELREYRLIIKTSFLSGEKVQVYNRTEEKLLAEVKSNIWTGKTEMSYNGEKYQYSSSFLGLSDTSWKKDGSTLMEFKGKWGGGEIISHVQNPELNALLILTGVDTKNRLLGWLVLIVLIVYFVFFR